MVNDPIGDMIIQIKNASLAGRTSIVLPYSKLKFAVAQILVREGYIASIEKIGESPKLNLRIDLRYRNGKSVITDLRRKSKPGLRVYVGKNEIPSVIGGMGLAIVSTSAGIMSGKEARKKGFGGEFLCEIW